MHIASGSRSFSKSTNCFPASYVVHVGSSVRIFFRMTYCLITQPQNMPAGSGHDAAVRGYFGAVGLACAFGLSAVLDTQFSLRLGRLQLHVRASIASAVYRCTAYTLAAAAFIAAAVVVVVVVGLCSLLQLLIFRPYSSHCCCYRRRCCICNLYDACRQQ